MPFLSDLLADSRKPVNSVSSFSFREVNGQKRVCHLQGRGLPRRPFRNSVRQRNDYSHLAGYREATIQLFGPEELPTSINGKWSDKWVSPNEAAASAFNGPIDEAFATIDNAIGGQAARIGLGSAGIMPVGNEVAPIEFDGSRVQNVRKAVEIFEQWVREGRLLDVSWDTRSYRGIIEEFETQWFTAHDVEWTMHFKWTGLSETPAPVLVAQELSVGDTASLFQALSDALNIEALPPGFPMAFDVFADISAGILRIADTSQRCLDTIASMSNLLIAPANAARQIIALGSTLRGQCDDLLTKLQATWAPGGRFFSRAPTSAELSTHSSTTPGLLRAEYQQSSKQRSVEIEYTNRVSLAVNALRRAAIAQVNAYIRTLEDDIEGTHTARAGDDLRKVSQQVYGTPDEWQRLMLFNDLTSPVLEANQVILIPRSTLMEGC